MTSLKPRVRAMFVDARTQRESLVTGLLTSRHVQRTRLDFTMRGETEKLDVLFEELDVALGETAPLHDRVARCRGIDVAVVVAGRATGRAADTLRMLHACGVRQAVALFESDANDARDLRENLGRHLLLDTAFDADVVPVIALSGSANALDARDAAALFHAIDDVAVPRVDDSFLAAGTNASGTHTATSRLVRGSLAPPRGKGSLFLPAYPKVIRERGVIIPARPDQFVDIAFGTGGGRPGDLVAFDLEDREVPWDFVLADRPLDFTKRIVVDVERKLIDGERVMAFGGDYGCTDGVVKNGVVELTGNVALVDGRVGLVRNLGYAQLSSVSARSA